MVKLGDVFDIGRGGSPRPIEAYLTDAPNGVNWIMISDTQENSKYIENTKKKIKVEGVKKSRYVHEGDFLLTNSMSFGHPYILKTAGCIHDGWLVLSPKKDNISNDFLYHLLSSDVLKREMLKNAKGAVVKNLNKEIVASLSFPLPPLEEQKRIAAILDKAHSIRQKRQKNLENADTLIKSVFLDMFGDPVTNPKGWEIMSLHQLGEVNRGISKHRPRNASFLLGGKYPLIQTGEVANANIFITDYSATYSEEGLKQSKMWPIGTLCITIAANIAKTAILKIEACFPDSIVGFSANKKTNELFIHFWFSFFQKILEEQAPESAQKNINLAILRELQVICPPIALQNKFAEIVTKIEAQKAKQQEHLHEADQAFKALQQQFFGL